MSVSSLVGVPSWCAWCTTQHVSASTLFLLVAGALFLMFDLLETAAFFLLAFGAGLLFFLVARMALDLRETFELARWMPALVVLLFFAGMFASGGASVLLFMSGILPQYALLILLMCVLVVVVVTMYGLSTDRVWTAEGFNLTRRETACEGEGGEDDADDAGDAGDANYPVRKGAWRTACEQTAERGGLTPRETEVFMLMAKGRNSAAIERELVISSHTVKTHMLSIYRKLDAHSVQQVIDLVEAEKMRQA